MAVWLALVPSLAVGAGVVVAVAWRRRLVRRGGTRSAARTTVAVVNGVLVGVVGGLVLAFLLSAVTGGFS